MSSRIVSVRVKLALFNTYRPSYNSTKSVLSSVAKLAVSSASGWLVGLVGSICYIFFPHDTSSNSAPNQLHMAAENLERGGKRKEKK